MGKSIRIAHVIPWTAVGGTELATLRIAKAIRECGHESLIYCLSEAHQVVQMFNDAGFETIRYTPAVPSLLHGRDYLKTCNVLRRSFQAARANLVHCADVLA